MNAEQHILLPEFSLQFEPLLRESLLVALGSRRLADIEAALPRPLNSTTVRVNAHNGTESVQQLALDVVDALADFKERLSATDRAPMTPVVWSDTGVILIPSVPASQELSARLATISKEVCVHRLCAESVLRGSDVYIRGVGMVSKGVVEDADVIISTITNDDEFPCRGTAISQHTGKRVVIGWGRTAVPRSQLVSENSGVAVYVQERFFFDAPSLNGLCQGQIYAQHIPSIYAVHTLQVQPSDVVLDMCASPGGKTSRIAEYLTGGGFVVAVDRTRVKVRQLLDTCAEQGVADRVYALYADAAKLVLSLDASSLPNEADRSARAILASMEPGTVCKAKGFYAETFDRILLDPSCSALGLRPKLSVHTTSLANIDSFVLLQRRLIRAAVQLLKVGGTLLYSTCTITAQENEMAVAYALQTFSCLRLVPCSEVTALAEDSSCGSLDHVGGIGLSDCGLSADECAFVRRFDPAIPSVSHPLPHFATAPNLMSTTAAKARLRDYRFLLCKVLENRPL